MTYYDDAVYTEDVDDQYVNIEGHINDIEIKKAESFKSILRDPINKVLCTGDPEHVASVLEDYKSAFPGLSIIVLHHSLLKLWHQILIKQLL